MWLLPTLFLLENSARVCTHRHIQAQNVPPSGWQVSTVLLFDTHQLLGAWQSVAALPGSQLCSALRGKNCRAQRHSSQASVPGVFLEKEKTIKPQGVFTERRKIEVQMI